MAKRDVVILRADERTHLLALTKKGTLSARKLTRAHLLLQAAAGAMDAAIAPALHVGLATVARVRKRFVEEGLEAALRERPRPGGHRKLEGKQAAFRMALACSTPPEGRRCWTMPLLAGKLVALQVVDALSDETVRRMRKTIVSTRGRRQRGVFPA
jgi:putative transposase